MKISELKNKLSEFDNNKDVVLFSNGYKEIKIIDSEDGLIISGKGKVCPSVKSAIENNGKEQELCDLCSWGNEDNLKLDRGE